MTIVHEMFKSHPQQPNVELEILAQCIERCFACAQACTICADACLGEPAVQDLIRCIRLNLDCASICKTTGRILACLIEPDRTVATQQLQACIAACHVCGAECQRHSAHHPHCATCAEACRQCEAACRALMKVV